MATPVTPEEWLGPLSTHLDEARPRIDLLRSYTDGNAPLPEAGKNIKAAWSAFQKTARNNVGDLIVEAPAERIICSSLSVAGGREDDDEARRIWVDNRMAIALGDTVRDMLTVGVGYMVVGNDNGRPVITSERPEQMYAATDPLRPWIARAGIKVWRDRDAGMDYAYVWADGERQKFERKSHDDRPKAENQLWTRNYGDTWEIAGEPQKFDGPVPIYVFQNHRDMGEFEAHTNVIDRINKDVLDRLVTSAMQAFRRRYLEGGLPKTDESGNPIDYSAIFEAAPGAVWDLPEGVTLKETQESAQSIMAMLSAEKDDLRSLAADTRTPLPMLVPEGQNQSAAGAQAAKEGLVTKTKDRIERVKAPLASVMTRAMQIAVPGFESVVEPSFIDPTFVTIQEKYEANLAAKSGDVPWRTRMTDILGFPGPKVDAMQTEREEEQLSLALFAGQPTPPEEPADAAVTA